MAQDRFASVLDDGQEWKFLPSSNLRRARAAPPIASWEAAPEEAMGWPALALRRDVCSPRSNRLASNANFKMHHATIAASAHGIIISWEMRMSPIVATQKYMPGVIVSTGISTVVLEAACRDRLHHGVRCFDHGDTLPRCPGSSPQALSLLHVLQQVRLDKVVQVAVHDGVHVGFFQFGAVVVDHRVRLEHI